MSREWKPGDVAMVTIGRVDFTAIRRYGGWTTACGHSDIEPLLCEIVAARPVAVLDPEDREAVERLAQAYRDEFWGSSDPVLPEHVDSLQNALREFASPTPPKPEEPLGLGAVVEDADGCVFIRHLPQDEEDEQPWFTSDGDFYAWATVSAVRVLSPGYTEGGAS